MYDHFGNEIDFGPAYEESLKSKATNPVLHEEDLYGPGVTKRDAQDMVFDTWARECNHDDYAWVVYVDAEGNREDKQIRDFFDEFDVVAF